MADENKKPKDDIVQIPNSQLTTILEKIAQQDIEIADMKAKDASMEEFFKKGGEAEGKPTGIREGKSFEPKFRTVRIRKYPIGTTDKEGYVIGWTSKGAYQMVDRTGVTPVTVDFIDIIFLGQKEPQPVRLLDLLNKGVQVHCKIVKIDKHVDKVPTGEEVNVTVFDPAHGLTQTGDVIDGFVGMATITYTIQIPGVDGTTVIDSRYVNA